MRKRLTLLTLFIILCSVTFAQNHNWADYNVYQESNGQGGADYMATIYVDGINLTDADNYDFAPFIGDKQCGQLQKIAKAPNGAYVVSFRIYANNGASVRFKLYDYATNAIYSQPSEEEYIYMDNQILGGIYNPMPLHFRSIAKVGDLRYGCFLQNAIDAAQEGDVVTITNNTTGAGAVINKDITIDFDGKAYSFNEGVGSQGTPSNGFQISAGNNVTLKNGSLSVADEAKDKFYILVQNYANLTVESMNLDGTNLDKWSATDGDSYTLSINSGDVNITGNTKIKANDEGDLAFAFDACKFQGYEAPVVTLGDDVTVEGRVELTGGQLYTNVDSIKAVCKKTVKGVQAEQGSTIGWNTISTPFQGAYIPEATAGTHDLYRYDEPSMAWRYYKDGIGDTGAEDPFETLDLGRGYLYINNTDITIALEGELNVDEVAFPLSYTEGIAIPGFNMVGNPFAHNISSDNFYTASAILADGFYLIGKNGEWLARPEGTEIAPMESVLVKTDKAEDLVIMPNADANAKANANVEEQQYLSINVANANYNDVAYVSFNEGMGLNKINHRNTEAPMVYLNVDGDDYAIAKMNRDVTEIPVSFVAKTMGEYTIGIDVQNCEYGSVTLVDRFTGSETNMLLEDYAFVASSNDNTERFIIRLSMKSEDDNNTENFAFINNDNMIIENIEGQGMIRIYDVMGRPVAEYSAFESASIPTAEYTTGMYIIQMSDDNGVKVQKVIID